MGGLAETSPRASDDAPAAPRRATVWRAAPTDLRPLDAGVDVWRADLAGVDPGLGRLLSSEERERAARISRARERELWQRSRGLLRALLARYLPAEPLALQIAFGPHGKPELAALAGADTGTRLWFNLSHSRDIALYALSADGPVGVDVQHTRDRGADGERDHVRLAARSLGAEQAQLLAELDPAAREDEFVRMWTHYEAELKRRGTGIGAASTAPATRGAEPWIVELDVGPGAAAALACTVAPCELRLWCWR